MQYTLLYSRAINERERQHQNFYQLERLAQELLQKSLNEDNIETGVTTKDTANAAVQKLLQAIGCTVAVKDRCYRYIVEHLAETPCLVINKGNYLLGVHHWRLSLLQEAKEESTNNALLQISFITSGALKSCSGARHYVKEGVSSWRYLSHT